MLFYVVQGCPLLSSFSPSRNKIMHYALFGTFYCLVVGNGGQEGVGAGRGVDFAAIVGHAVADNQEAGVEHKVVTHNLVENVLRDIHSRRFILHNHRRTAVAVEDDGVAAAGSAVQFDAAFVGDKACRITEILDEMVDEILPDPLLWCQSHEFLAYPVENLEHIAVAADSGAGIFRKIQFLNNRLFSDVKLRFFMRYIKNNL